MSFSFGLSIKLTLGFSSNHFQKCHRTGSRTAQTAPGMEPHGHNHSYQIGSSFSLLPKLNSQIVVERRVACNRNADNLGRWGTQHSSKALQRSKVLRGRRGIISANHSDRGQSGRRPHSTQA